VALGPGKYDSECTQVMVAQHADAVILIVIGGNKGSGFACQATPEITVALPKLLRNVADEIERSGFHA
jgi:hypothetical protein